jgi:hypothetical protein
VERRHLGFCLQVARGLLCEWGQLECNLALEPLEASLLHNRMDHGRLLCQDWPLWGLECLLPLSLSLFRSTFSVPSLNHAWPHVLCGALVRLAGALLEVPGRVVERVTLTAPFFWGLIPKSLFWLHFRDHLVVLMLRFLLLRVSE